MEMTDDSIDTRLRGIADEIKTDEMAFVKKPMITQDDDDLRLINEYSRQIGTPFKQQKLSAWQPILTASTVIPWLLAIGILFLPIGTLLLNASNRIQEFQLDYTDCISSITGKQCSDSIENNTKADCLCSIEFKLNESYDKDVFFYYALSNFYQNHRRYVRSRNDWQLLGYTLTDTSSSCAPFDRAYDELAQQSMPVAPCGAIANSLFNDTFELFYERKPVPFLEYDISWPTDRLNKFKNPANLSELKKFTHPVNWQRYLQEYESGNKTAFENEHLIVWMRSAALPSFRKLYARVDHTQDTFKQGIPKGNYRIEIRYNFPVTQFNGRKYFVISNTSWLGGKNPFLGYAYIITGFLCIVITGVLFFIYKKYGFRERDMTQIDNNTPFIYSNLNQTT